MNLNGKLNAKLSDSLMKSQTVFKEILSLRRESKQDSRTLEHRLHTRFPGKTLSHQRALHVVKYKLS